MTHPATPAHHHAVRSDDRDYVREQYASEEGLATRAGLYLHGVDGVDARDVVAAELRRRAARSVLEVGCGWGELAERIGRETGAEVAALDLSPRMVELACERGVNACVGDVQALPFDDSTFDAVVAAWMLYHVPDLDRALAEIARVLRPGGALVAVTNGRDDLAELWELVGRDLSFRELTFRSENGEEYLRRHFSSVEGQVWARSVTFPDREAVRRYVGSGGGRLLVDRVPELDGPLSATKVVAVFVATKAV